MTKEIKPIALYLPQYHPIPENDEWWGKGFTEWTNVTKAKALFKGHYQPHLPTDLGFYDLRVEETRIEQAEMAKKYGIYGFCYYHYWFGNGKTILAKPFQDVLSSGKPDFPFCLCWANESWSGIWHGLKNKTLIEQQYPGKEDYINHFNYLLPAFKDDRYIKVEDKPMLVIYMPNAIPDLDLFVSTFNQLAQDNEIPGIHFVGTNVHSNWDFESKGFEAITLSNHSKLAYIKSNNIFIDFKRRVKNRPKIASLYKAIFKKPTHIYEYKEAMKQFVNEDINHQKYYPMVIPNWDNSPRSGLNGFILKNSTPELFKMVFEKACDKVSSYQNNNKYVFIKSWNEWAEGNHLEPDRQFGHKYLEVIKDVLSKFSKQIK